MCINTKPRPTTKCVCVCLCLFTMDRQAEVWAKKRENNTECQIRNDNLNKNNTVSSAVSFRGFVSTTFRNFNHTSFGGRFNFYYYTIGISKICKVIATVCRSIIELCRIAFDRSRSCCTIDKSRNGCNVMWRDVCLTVVCLQTHTHSLPAVTIWHAKVFVWWNTPLVCTKHLHFVAWRNRKWLATNPSIHPFIHDTKHHTFMHAFTHSLTADPKRVRAEVNLATLSFIPLDIRDTQRHVECVCVCISP